MLVHTKYTGEIDVNEQDVVTFKQGLPSFETETTFVLLPFGEATSPFFILQSTKTVELAFIVMNPFTFFPDYSVELSDQTIESLEIEKDEDVTLFVMLTLKDSWADSTANLRGPIIVNHVNRTARQIANPAYTTKHELPTPVKGEK
ncbi:flagellar assembly protein FliW [Paenalkalicoccus suaedae]|uniref:Flagellar assembly factor FliW n=1 Tax=Paenalkalicoccus suaedae TaxID=2592382 RepID=A0A859FJ23_9BACI|nr:flagellar assembly protein FliW [Paenalkalicoccus suaedae]QKS72355.1 flagellar assembly protein FliW [Paenalkalicoccus suaedae]